MTQGNSASINIGELNVLPCDQDNPLSEVIAQNIPACKQLDILVGFFYFDGIEKIRQTLAQNTDIQIRILVGMAAGVDTKGLVEYAQRYETLTKEQIAEEYRRQVRDVIRGLSAENDKLNSKKIVCLYADMINQGRLLIRQTREPNHSKLYIFNQKQETDSCYLVGSSNFSQPGIVTRQELNVKIRRAGLTDVQSLFNDLWKQAVPVTRYEKFTDAPAQPPPEPDPTARVLTEETRFANITPYNAYLMLMQRYLKLYEGKEDAERIRLLIQGAKCEYPPYQYTPYQYQVDAVSRALTIFRRSHGVLVADVVGLGKSIVAATIAKASHGPGIMLCPPHLISDWVGSKDDNGEGRAGYFDQFGLDKAGWKAFSMYQLDKVLDFVKGHAVGLVIVDEAHRFRNPTLERYADLAAICANRKVVLLTATPFNNRPRDIHALLGLFHDPNAACATGETFKNAMERLDKEYIAQLKLLKDEPGKKSEIKQALRNIAGQVLQIMRDVTIRRNRLDLKNNPVYCAEAAEHLSEQQPPMARSYCLTSKTGDFFDRVLDTYFGGKKLFKGAIYRPTRYLKTSNQAADAKEGQFQENYYGMLCRFLVNRFESSFAAFKESVESVRDYSKTALKYFDKDNVLVLSRELFRRLEDQEPDTFDFKVELERYRDGLRKNAPNGKRGKRKKFAEYPEDKLDAKRFREDVKSDIDLLDEILDEIKTLKLLEKGNDPKLEAVIVEIRKVLNNRHGDIKTEACEPTRKVVVFSGFADTVSYIGKRINAEFGVDKVLVVIGNKDADDPEVLTLKEGVKRTIRTNFDARECDANSPVTILVATDTISEGLNLNQAGLVINYDIPWNPTRVIQRIGRINRIGKKVFRDIYVMNLFPSDKGEGVIGKTERVKTKLQMIHDIVKEDAQILDIDEMPQAASLQAGINGAIEVVERDERSEETLVRERWSDCEKSFIKVHGKKEWDEKMAKLASLPSALKVVAKMGDKDSLAVFRDNGLMLSALCVQNVHTTEPAVVPSTFLKALEALACDEGTPSVEFNEAYWKAYEEVMKYTPLRDTKSASNPWVKASNVLSTESLYKELSKSSNSIRLRMLEACGKRQIHDATLKQLSDVLTGKDLESVLLRWNERQCGMGASVPIRIEGDAGPTGSILAFGTSRLENRLHGDGENL